VSAQGFNGGGFNVGLGPFAASGGGTTTLDPANLGTSQALSNGNLTDSFVSGSDGLARSIANHSTGKYYCEFIYGHVGNNGVGIMDGSGSVNSYLYGTNHQFGTFFSGAWSGSGLLGTTTADSFVATNVGALALDIGNQAIWIKNLSTAGFWNANATANPATNTNGCVFSGTLLSGTLYVTTQNSGASDNVTFNFGATAYTGTVPSGFGNW
jgi:hypothetical protein